jgi:hypothetical protein
MYFTADGYTSVAIADHPKGPFVQEGGRIFRQLLKKEVTYQPAVAVDENERYLLVRRDGSGAGIWSFKLEDDGMTVSRPMRKLLGVPTEKKGTADDWELLSGKTVQSPFVMQKDSSFVMLYCANDTLSPLRGIGIASANKLYLTWRKNKSNPVLLRTDDQVGIGGASLFTDVEGGLRMVFHAWNSVTTPHPRRMYIADVAFEGDTLHLTGNPLIVPRLDTSGIRPVDSEPAALHEAYDLQGRPATPATPGIRIVRTPDGKTKKEIGVASKKLK